MKDVITWSGWVGGIAVGLYMLAQFWISGRGLGVSTGFGNVWALTSRLPFFRRAPYEQPTNWRLWFVVGIPLGGAIAALTSGVPIDPHFNMGAMYEQVMPASLAARGAFLVGGGVLIGYGARLAGGCTSGHSITGLSLLNPPSLLASAGFFIGGIAAVQVMFRFFG